MARKPRKPTGEITSRPLVLRPGQEARLGSTKLFKLPEVKAQAEFIVMQKTISCMSSMPLLPKTPISFTKFPKEEGPDFNIAFSDGSNGYAEITEIAPLMGPYQEAPRFINVGQYIQHVKKLVMRKCRIYNSRKLSPIILILYVSHDTFIPTPEIAEAISYNISHLNSNPFLSITLTLFGYDGNPLVVQLLPSPIHLYSKQYNAIEHKSMGLTSTADMEVVKGGMNKDGYVDAVVRFKFPEGTPSEVVQQYLNGENIPGPMHFDLGDNVVIKK